LLRSRASGTDDDITKDHKQNSAGNWLTDRPLKILSLRYLHVDPANRKAVDAAKEEIVRKICLLDLKKRPLLGKKN
jgi:hypothetical protein